MKPDLDRYRSGQNELKYSRPLAMFGDLVCFPTCLSPTFDGCLVVLSLPSGGVAPPINFPRSVVWATTLSSRQIFQLEVVK